MLPFPENFTDSLGKYLVKDKSGIVVWLGNNHHNIFIWGKRKEEMHGCMNEIEMRMKWSRERTQSHDTDEITVQITSQKQKHYHGHKHMLSWTAKLHTSLPIFIKDNLQSGNTAEMCVEALIQCLPVWDLYLWSYLTTLLPVWFLFSYSFYSNTVHKGVKFTWLVFAMEKLPGWKRRLIFIMPTSFQ